MRTAGTVSYGPDGGVGAIKASLVTILGKLRVTQTLLGGRQHSVYQDLGVGHGVERADLGQIRQVGRGQVAIQSKTAWA